MPKRNSNLYRKQIEAMYKALILRNCLHVLNTALPLPQVTNSASTGPRYLHYHVDRPKSIQAGSSVPR